MSSAVVQDAVRAGVGLGARRSLSRAFVDFYEHSWRLLVMNTTLSLVALTSAAAFAYFIPVAVVLALLVGPLLAALMHAAVTIVETEDVRLGDFVAGLRLHWRRGLVLGAVVAAFALGSAIAFWFYSGKGAAAWPLAIVVLYLAALFAVFQVALWPLAIFERDRPLLRVLHDAMLVTARRPSAIVGLTFVLLLINLAGIAAAVLPFLTMTIAYSFIAAARFSLPWDVSRED